MWSIPSVLPYSPFHLDVLGPFLKSRSSTLSLWLYSQPRWNQASLAHSCPRATPAISTFQPPASWPNLLLFVSMDLSSSFLQSSNFGYSVLQTPLPDWLFPQPMNLVSAQKRSLPVQTKISTWLAIHEEMSASYARMQQSSSCQSLVWLSCWFFLKPLDNTVTLHQIHSLCLSFS